MSDIALDTDGDIIVTSDFSLTTGRDAILQHLKQRLKTFYGEWFLDKRIGIAYFEQVFKKSPDAVVVDSIFKREIINTPGIIELTRFSLDLTGRELSLSFSARTNDGIINFSEVLP